MLKNNSIFSYNHNIWKLMKPRNFARASSLIHTSRSSSGYSYPRLQSYSTVINVETFKEKPRINPVGIQYLSNSLQRQLFGGKNNSEVVKSLSQKDHDQLLKLAKVSLRNHDLLGKKTAISEPISFKLPELQGNSLDEHFQKLGHFASEPYKTMATKKFTQLPKKPVEWLRKPGWTRYELNKDPISVPYPKENTLVFDIETLYKISPYPTMAVAVSEKAWYSWCSPFICSPENNSFKHLVPLNTTEKEQLIIGHNVGYDRARVLEEYNIKNSKAFFLDTQSLHIASTGLCSRQRSLFQKNLKKRKQLENGDTTTEDGEDLSKSVISDMDDDPWLGVSALNSLKDVAEYHCKIKMDKQPRDFFASLDKNNIIDNFQLLMGYCATDVEVTSKVFDKVFKLFLEKCPHPVSFGALKSLSSCILPLNKDKWTSYIDRSENIYQSSKTEIENKIKEIIDDLVKLKDMQPKEMKKIINNDPWLRQLDWTIKPIRMTKKGVPAKKQKKPGYPEWYKDLFPNNETKEPQITIRTRKIPIFFKLKWEGYPVVWTKESGWCFPVPVDLVDQFKSKNYVEADNESQELFVEETNSSDILLKVPHPDGPKSNCTTLLSKPYFHFFEKNILTSQSNIAKEALEINTSTSYWVSARERIMSQFVVSKKDIPTEFNFNRNNEENIKDSSNLGIILPQLLTMGTVTRRAVENTWLTASNAKKSRIGSELKTQIQAPKGYRFVGADVDSEELWIASLVGDSVFNLHGGTPIGWMCLEGTKNEGTDLHTKTANLLGCSRNDAKIFNYGRIYGAGVKFAGHLLKRFNPTLTDQEAKKTAVKLYDNTKGKSKRSKIFEKFWYGGSESILFNKLENIAEQDIPRTPVLGCSITNALMKGNLVTNSFLPSRINWAIQSSGVDYLHLLCCSMNYLIAKYNLDARLSITIHDEIRFLVAEKDVNRVAMALQVSNIWTRAMFCEQIGIDDLPQNCAFFSAIDVDNVLRKEVDMDCITPSNSEAIPPGYTLNINELLELPDAQLSGDNKEVDVSKYTFQYREPVFAEYNKAYSKEFLNYFLKMQVQSDSNVISQLEREYTQRSIANEFSRETRNNEYTFSDYIKDIKVGKIKKINIMNPTLLSEKGELERQHELVLGAGKVNTRRVRRKLTLDRSCAPRKSPRSTTSTNYYEMHRISSSLPLKS